MAGMMTVLSRCSGIYHWNGEKGSGVVSTAAANDWMDFKNNISTVGIR